MKQSIKYLIKKFIQDECTPDEIAILISYFQNKDIDQAFPEVEEVLEWLENQPEMDKKAVEEIYDIIVAKSKPPKKKSNPRKYLSWAALFIGIVGIGLFFTLPKESQIENSTFDFNNAIILKTDDGKTQYITEEDQIQLTDKTGKVIGSKEDQVLVYQSGQDDQSEEITYNTLTIPYGKRFQIKLADGSHVFLNAGSSLRYPVRFPKEGKREVFLTGEAYFDIEEDKNRPFIVEANEVKVNVLGTRFNVSSFSKEEIAEVALVEGSVDLSSRDNSVILKPGQLATFTKKDKEIEVKEVDTKLYTAWMKGEMVFRNETLDEILKRMERHYNITIINKESKLSKERFNATFKEESADKILEYFNTIYGLKFTRKNKDTLIIQPDMMKTAEP